MNTADLLARLRRHYIKPGEQWPGGIFLPEVGWNGGGAGGRADALYVGFTSTSGRRLVGHELKVSRSDWLHELAQPGKADGWHDNCHQWYLVSPSEEITPREELPAGWGLMVPTSRSKTRLQIVVKAEVRKVSPSWDACRSIMSRYDTLRGQALAEERLQIQRRERELAGTERRLSEAGERALPREDRDLLDAARSLREQGVDLHAFRFGDTAGCSVDEFLAALRLAKAAGKMAGNRDQWVVREIRERAERMLDGLAEFEKASEGLRAIAGVKR